MSTIDVPARFKNSKAVGPSLGLTPVRGDEAMRVLLYEAAQVMLRRGPRDGPGSKPGPCRLPSDAAGKNRLSRWRAALL